MTTIYLETSIQAPRKTCFDFARSIDLHAASMSLTSERAVEGRISGFIQLGEFVTWEATHFMVRQRLSSRIIELVEPEYFIDEMINGAFKSLWHKHSFVQTSHGTLMIDDFKYEVPYGFLGAAFNFLALKNYLRKLLLNRNAIIKKTSETSS